MNTKMQYFSNLMLMLNSNTILCFPQEKEKRRLAGREQQMVDLSDS